MYHIHLNSYTHDHIKSARTSSLLHLIYELMQMDYNGTIEIAEHLLV
jgi:hypothetical protein